MIEKFKIKKILIISLIVATLLGTINVFADSNNDVNKFSINQEQMRDQMLIDQFKKEEIKLLEKIKKLENQNDDIQDIVPYELPRDHWCHPGDRHDRCIRIKPTTDPCGCIYSGYKCCCGAIVEAKVQYCDYHGRN